ncbi:MAG TPA: hypothetical protein VLK29_05835 [Luteimonas sp.]|nr:hypothetical protein [Luteimonas sp.]
MRILDIVFMAATLLPIAATTSADGATTGISYPSELHGTWDLGPHNCRLPLNPDSDTPLRIESGRVLGYEHVETPLHVGAVSSRPRAWTVTAISDEAPGIEIDDLYILKDDHLTISDGETTRQFRRCR